MQQTLAKTLLRPCLAVNWQQDSRRHLFRWLSVVWNNVDETAIKELGTEVAAAQWLLRNGAKVKWSKSSEFFNDYGQLMENSDNLQKDVLVEIDATESSISHVGFPYLKNLKSLRKIVFNESEYLQDRALQQLSLYQLPSLKHLEIIKCHDITDTGIRAVQSLKSLEYLKLQELSSVSDQKACYDGLKEHLTKCKIEWN